MAKEVVTGVNKVGNNFYRTKVVDNGDSTFSSTLLRTDAQGNNGVPIAGYGAVGNQLATEINTTNATVDEQRLLADPSSQLNQVRREQVRSTESQFFGTAATPTQKSALDQVGGGSGNTSTTTGSTDQQGGSTPTSNQNQTQSTSGDGVLIYPLNMAKTQQDRLKFIAVEYQPPGNLATGTLGSQNRTSTQGKKIIGSVFLPIQASISDFNSVEWQGGSLNELQRAGVNLSSDVMNAKNQKDLEAAATKSGQEAVDALIASNREIKIALAGAAVGVENLLSRFGSVLNPNLELLFTGPQLRPFEFKFQMSAREKAEGENIKKIINFFKKNMATKKDDNLIFLRAPNTFLIEYKYNGPNDTHPGINLIKECALLSCSVEYTPLGTYMTYPDGTMVSYTMSLSFQELEPVYDKDYSGHPIGY
jgi:hypothetical protein